MDRESGSLLRSLQNAIKALRNRFVNGIILILGILTIILTAIEIYDQNIEKTLMLAVLSLLLFVLKSLERKIAHWDEELKLLAKGIVDLDAVLDNREGYPIDFQDRIKSARKLWVQAVSGENILNKDNLGLICKSEILMHPNGELRIIIQDPEEETAVKMIIDQLEKHIGLLDIDIRSSIDETLENLKNLEKNLNEAVKSGSEPWTGGAFEYRLLPFSPGFNLVIIDPDTDHGIVAPEFYGFGNENAKERMHIEFTKRNSKTWFDYWKKQFENLWKETKEGGRFPPLNGDTQ